MKANRHTFLFTETLWTAAGLYILADGRRVDCEGWTRIIHNADVWVNDGAMKLLLPEPVEFQNRYEFSPLTAGATVAEWRSINPGLGVLHGRFIIVEDSIISPWESEDGKWRGWEFILQTDAFRYLSRGCIMQGEVLAGSWVMELSRSE